jgi:hypothetical protein
VSIDPLADALHPRAATGHAERHVGAEPRREIEIVAAGPAQDRRRVGRAAAEAGARRDPLREVHVRLAADRAQRPPDEVVVVDGNGEAGRRLDDVQPVAGADAQLVGQVERHHLRVDQVVSVGSHAGHPQRHRQLGRRRHHVHGLTLGGAGRGAVGPAARRAMLVS